MHGRVLVLEALETGAHAQAQRFRNLDGQHRLGELPRAVHIGGGGPRRRHGVRRAAVPRLAVGPVLAPELHAVRPQTRVLVPRRDAGIALYQFVAIAHQAQGDAVVLDGGRAFHRAAPALTGQVKELGDGHVEPRGPHLDVEDHLDAIGNLATKNVVLHGARVKFLSQAAGQIVQGCRIQFFSDYRQNVLAQRRADLSAAIRLHVGAPAVATHHDGLHGVLIVDVELGILGSRGQRRREQHSDGHHPPEPNEFHAAFKCTHATNYK